MDENNHHLSFLLCIIFVCGYISNIYSLLNNDARYCDTHGIVTARVLMHRHTSYYRARLIIVHQPSFCLPCIHGPISVTICEVHVPNINRVFFFWLELRNWIETGIL